MRINVASEVITNGSRLQAWRVVLGHLRCPQACREITAWPSRVQRWTLEPRGLGLQCLLQSEFRTGRWDRWSWVLSFNLDGDFGASTISAAIFSGCSQGASWRRPTIAACVNAASSKIRHCHCRQGGLDDQRPPQAKSKTASRKALATAGEPQSPQAEWAPKADKNRRVQHLLAGRRNTNLLPFPLSTKPTKKR